MNGGADEVNDFGEELCLDSLSVISICYSNKKIGIAHFNQLNNEIQTDCVQVSLDDTAEVLENIKIHTNPTLILVHPSIVQNTPFLQLLISKNRIDNEEYENAGDQEAADVYRYLSLKTSCWNANNAMSFICTSLLINGVNDAGAVQDQKTNYLKLISVIDLENPHILQSLGALVSYLHGNAVNLAGGLVRVAKLSVMQQQRYLQMDTNTFRSLQVFTDEIHPNLIKGGKNKEGFSLFSLIDRTRSLPGREKLKEWMSRPLCDLSKICLRQDGVAMVVRTKNIDFVSSLCKHMRHVHSMPKALLKIKKAQASHLEWIKLLKTLEAGLQIAHTLGSFLAAEDGEPADRRFVGALLGGYDPSTALQLYQRLQLLVDLDASLAEKRLVIHEGYDRLLDQMRGVFMGLEGRLTRAAHGILEELPLLQSVSVEYVPQVGFVVAVAADQTHFVEPLLAGGGGGAHSFFFIYSHGKTSFYKHRIVIEMDDSIGDIKSLISDRQKLLLLDLEEYALEAESDLQRMAQMLETLDATLSLGALAQEQDWVRPKVVGENVLVIKGGRHPISSLGGDAFVPNDTFVTDEKCLAIITGPNSSGKSVYLKQVGLLTYLAHVGSYIPCERAIVGLTDKILTRISANESVAAPCSSFCIDLAQLAKMVSAYTPRSLCLVDEFGKGTTPLDGISLLGACVRRFASHRTKSFFVLHFTEILQCKEVLDVAGFTCITTLCMEVHESPRRQCEDPFGDPSDGEEAQEDAVPLYRLRVGVAASSEGLQCAKMAGVSQAVLARAAAVKRAIEKRERLPAAIMKTGAPLQQRRSRSLLLGFMSQEQWAQAQEDEVEAFRALLPA